MLHELFFLVGEESRVDANSHILGNTRTAFLFRSNERSLKPILASEINSDTLPRKRIDNSLSHFVINGVEETVELATSTLVVAFQELGSQTHHERGKCMDIPVLPCYHDVMEINHYFIVCWYKMFSTKRFSAELLYW